MAGLARSLDKPGSGKEQGRSEAREAMTLGDSPGQVLSRGRGPRKGWVDPGAWAGTLSSSLGLPAHRAELQPLDSLIQEEPVWSDFTC